MHDDRLREIMDRFSDLSILVVGDFFLDEYLITDPSLTETSIETGLDAYQVVDRREAAHGIRRGLRLSFMLRGIVAFETFAHRVRT